MSDEMDSFKWLEELLTTPPDVRRMLKERTRTYIILGKAAEEFVREIFEKLGYKVTPHFRKGNIIFDFLAQNKDENLLVEVKLRGRAAPTTMFNDLSRRAQSVGKEYGFYLVTFDRSEDVKKHKRRFQRYFDQDFKVDWVSVEDLLGLSDYKPYCGSLKKDDGNALLRVWRNRMVHGTIQYFKSRGLERPREIASSILKLADERKELTIDDFDVIKTLSIKMKERFPRFFESFTFYCEKCNKRYRMTPVIWSDRKNEYVVLCPECKQKVEEIHLEVPITVNIQMVILDTSAIIDGVFSKIVDQGFLQKGIFVIIPEVIDQELEMMEKPHPSFNEEVKRDLKRKFKEANNELQRLIKQDLMGLIQLRRHIGDRLNEEKIRLKLEGIDRHASDRLLVETCKQIGALLITKDEGLATRASADKINVFLISKGLV